MKSVIIITMKVGLVCPYDIFSPGGVKEHVFGLSNFFKKKKISVKIIAPRTREIDSSDFILVGNSFKVPSGTGSWGRISFSLKEGEIEEMLKREKFDLLHFHEPLVPFLSWRILLSSKTVNIATFHSAWEDGISLISNFHFLLSPFARIFGKKLGGLIAVSKIAKKCWQKFFPHRKIVVIPNGIDCERFKSKRKKKREGEIRILFVGRIEKRKGLIYLLRALRRIKEEKWHLIVVGNGPRMLEAKAYVFLSGLEERVEFRGRVEEEKLPLIYQEADIACFPSIGGESFGIVLLEAMASSLPIVCFKNPGYQEVLKNYPCRECLVEIRDVESLSSALLGLIRSPRRRLKLGEWGRREVKKYSWEEVGKKVLDYYEKCLKEFGRS